jgi:hypothetical protein
MLRLNGNEAPGQPAPCASPAVEPEYAVPPVGDSALETSLLPRDHPKWNADALTLSQRARELIARLRPVIVRVLTFWDHRIRSITIGKTRLGIDASGSYRAE